MKKNLLLLAGALATASWAMAIDEPTVVPSTTINRISSNGKFAGSIDEADGGTMTLIDLSTGKITKIQDSNYVFSPGMGNYVSDTGIIVMSGEDEMHIPYYWENGEIHELPLQPSDTGTCLSQGITADGSRICGQVSKVQWGLDATQIMAQPVVWNRNEDGGYDDYIEIPFPELDFSGRVPQMATALWISDDGKKIIGSVVDFSGFASIPILYSEDEKGNWSWNYIWKEPDASILGQAPTEPNDVDIEDFMTPEELEKYNEATMEWEEEYYTVYDQEPMLKNYMTEEELQNCLDYWTEEMGYDPGTWIFDYEYYIKDFCTEEEYEKYMNDREAWLAILNEIGPRPDINDYITKEELAAYEKAEQEYYDQSDLYYAWLWEFYDFLDTCDLPPFDFNSVYLSANGKYALAVSAGDAGWWEYVYTNYVYDIDNQTWETLPGEDFFGSFVANDGTVLAGSPGSSYLRSAYQYQNEEWKSLLEIMEMNDKDTYSWMLEEMTHLIPIDYNWETDEFVYDNMILTGTPTASKDLKVYASWIYNDWDYENGIYGYSYIIPNKESDSFITISADEINKVRYFDLQGRAVANPISGQLMIKVQGDKATKVIIR